MPDFRANVRARVCVCVCVCVTEPITISPTNGRPLPSNNGNNSNNSNNSNSSSNNPDANRTRVQVIKPLQCRTSDIIRHDASRDCCHCRSFVIHLCVCVLVCAWVFFYESGRDFTALSDAAGTDVLSSCTASHFVEGCVDFTGLRQWLVLRQTLVAIYHWYNLLLKVQVFQPIQIQIGRKRETSLKWISDDVYVDKHLGFLKFLEKSLIFFLLKGTRPDFTGLHMTCVKANMSFHLPLMELAFSTYQLKCFGKYKLIKSAKLKIAFT